MEISGRTRVLGILANPIHHVKTPELMNRLLESRGEDWIMIPVHVASEDFERLVRGLRGMRNFDGFIATVPHKVAMLSLCDEVTPDAAQIGAVNVVRRTADARFVGTMLDGVAFVTGLRAEGFEPAGRSAYLAGAGGTASAIAFALAKAGVKRLTIANRTSGKALQLIARVASSYQGLALDVGTSDPAGHDLVINATSLGLHAGDQLPLNVERLTPSQVVADVVIDPAETPLLLAAKSRGCRVHYGLPTLASQIELMAAFMGTPTPATRPL